MVMLPKIRESKKGRSWIWAKRIRKRKSRQLMKEADEEKINEITLKSSKQVDVIYK